MRSRLTLMDEEVPRLKKRKRVVLTTGGGVHLFSNLRSPHRLFSFQPRGFQPLLAAALAFKTCDPLVLFALGFAAVSLSFTRALDGGWASLSRSYLSDSYRPCHCKEGTSEGETPTWRRRSWPSLSRISRISFSILLAVSFPILFPVTIIGA